MTITSNWILFGDYSKTQRTKFLFNSLKIFNTMEFNYAGFWRRVAAYLIDMVLLMIPYYILSFALGINMMANMDPMSMDSEMPSGMTTLIVLLTILFFGYFAYFESSSYQATPGKMAMKIKVTDLQGGRISFLKALWRNVSKIFSSLILYIGYLMAGFTQRKQALHDMIAGTLVIQSEGTKELDTDV